MLRLHLNQLLLLAVGHDLRDEGHLEELLIGILPATRLAIRGGITSVCSHGTLRLKLVIVPEAELQAIATAVFTLITTALARTLVLLLNYLLVVPLVSRQTCAEIYTLIISVE